MPAGCTVGSWHTWVIPCRSGESSCSSGSMTSRYHQGARMPLAANFLTEHPHQCNPCRRDNQTGQRWMHGSWHTWVIPCCSGERPQLWQ